MEAVNSGHENSVFLPGHRLDAGVRATGDLADLAGCDAWLVVTPAQHMRSVLEAAPDVRQAADPLLEGHRGAQRLPAASMRRPKPARAQPIAVLSGPDLRA